MNNPRDRPAEPVASTVQIPSTADAYDEGFWHGVRSAEDALGLNVESKP